MRSAADLIAAELLANQFDAVFELDFILIRPPLSQIAMSIEFTALVIETMSHLVPNDHADTTVVGASSASMSKNGGCRRAAGKTISFISAL